MTGNDYKNFLIDLTRIIKERALEAKADKQKTERQSKDYLYEAGRVMGFNEVISIMQQHAEGFGIPLSELRLDDIQPDRDLI